MASWFELPAEIRQTILEYLLARIRVKLMARFITARLAAKTKKAPIRRGNDTQYDVTGKDLVASLLFVSKRFITCKEIEVAVLHGATISLDDPQALYKIEKRYRIPGMAAIKELHITKQCDDTRSSSIAMLPSAATLVKLKSLQRLTLYLAMIWTHTDPTATLDDLLLVADGYELENDDTWYVRKDLQNVLERLLYRVGDRSVAHLVRWLCENADVTSRVERVLKWKVKIPVNEDFLIQYEDHEIRFSTASWCIELIAGGRTILCPQRISDDRLNVLRDLRDKVKEIEADKYYVNIED